MPSLLPARWSVSAPKPVRVDPVLFEEGDDGALGCEAAFPALQLEDWNVPHAPQPPREPSLN